MTADNFVIDIDPNFLKTQIPTIAALPDYDITWLWTNQFAEQGIPSSPRSYRENFVKEVVNLTNGQILEIGPFDSPVVRGPNVKYFDVLNSEELLARANEHHRATLAVPEIDFCDKDGNLMIVDEKFDIVISSHCIEHQVDLIQHLNDVHKILNDDGFFALIIPDKRYCFDHYLPETTIADVIEAHENCGKSHSLKSVIEHHALTTHNDALRHWVGDHGELHSPNFKERIIDAVSKFNGSGGDYIDVHAWQFTPSSFIALMNILNVLGLSPFTSVRASGTPFGRQEFTAIMKSR